MKKFTIFASMICYFLLTINVNAQDSAKKADKVVALSHQVEAKNYTFVAQYAQPVRGTQKYLTANTYDLKIVKDSVIAYLPFYGRVYMNPPMNPDDAGIKFTSVKFEYKSEPMKKGGWNITIIPSDTNAASKILLQIFSNGNANLQVFSNTRDQMSFIGTIKEAKK